MTRVVVEIKGGRIVAVCADQEVEVAICNHDLADTGVVTLLGHVDADIAAVDSVFGEVDFG